MKRWQVSILGGVLVTVALIVANNLIKSSIVRFIFWQCAIIGFRRCLPDELCEGTPIDFPVAIICLILTVALYSLLIYGVLSFFAKKRDGNFH
ncbi:MAG TPA: hypothetical protein VGC91_09515 [Pyrinomonadaceae bacterium]